MSKTVFGENYFNEQSQSLYSSIVEHVPEKTLLAIIDGYNASTCAHSRGVAQIMAEFATSNIIDIDPTRQESLVRVAALHDLGKLSVSSLILNAPCRLTPEDWLQIEHHPIDGFHRYALQFSPKEALPILLHHSMQLRNYPPKNIQEEAISIYDLSAANLDDEAVLTDTLLLAVSDHLEARYPIPDFLHQQPGTRAYDHRNYPVSELPNIVKASFTEAGMARKFDLTNILDKLIEHFQEIISNSHNSTK